MNLLNQVLQDRRLTEAQSSICNFSVLQTKRQITSSNLNKISAALKENLTSRDILHNSVKRSLFWRYLKKEGFLHFLVFYEACRNCVELPSGARQNVLLRQLLRSYFIPSSPSFLAKGGDKFDQELMEEQRAAIEAYLSNQAPGIEAEEREKARQDIQKRRLQARKVSVEGDEEEKDAKESPRDETLQALSPRRMSSNNAHEITADYESDWEERNRDHGDEEGSLDGNASGSAVKEMLTKTLNYVLDKLDTHIPAFVDSTFGETLSRFENYARKPRTAVDFERLRTLGEGGFGKVHAVRVADTGALYALKEMSKVRIITKKRVNTVVNEATILRKCNYPFCARLHQVFSDDTSVYFLMDILTGGELKYHLRRMPTISNDLAQFWGACLVLGIAYLHSRNVIHRDLKLSNVLLDSEGYVCITDFGLSITAEEGKDLRHDQCCGTPGYIAPEMYLGPCWDRRSKSSSESRRNSTKTSFLSTIQSSMRNFATRRSSKVETEIAETISRRPTRRLSTNIKIEENAPLNQTADPSVDPARTGLAVPIDIAEHGDAPNDFEQLQRVKYRASLLENSDPVEENDPEADFQFPRYKNYGKSVDWYAFGVLMHQLYCLGRLPFSRGPKRSHRCLVRNMVNGRIRWSDNAMQCLEKNKSEMRKRRRDPNREKKPLIGLTAEAKDLIEKLLHHDPKTRLGCGPSGVKEIMAHPFFDGLDWGRLEKRHIPPPFKPKSDTINAELQQADWDPQEPTRRERRRSLALTDDAHRKIFQEIEYVRPETFFEELIHCQVDFESHISSKAQRAACSIM